MMHEGQLSRGQMQAWALNRYYYQSRIPIKDAIILSRSDDPDFRRAWRKRVVDHDGDSAQEGGIERWIRLAEATGLDRQRVMGCDEVLPAIRYAVDAYLDLVKAEGLSDRSRLLMTYALCGFANFGSLGIMIGGMSTMCPERRPEIVSLGMKSIVAGTLATCLTAATVGLIV